MFQISHDLLYYIFCKISYGEISFISVNANHFLPKSFIEAPIWYSSSSIIKNLSCDLSKYFTIISGYCLSCRLMSSFSCSEIFGVYIVAETLSLRLSSKLIHYHLYNCL